MRAPGQRHSRRSVHVHGLRIKQLCLWESADTRLHRRDYQISSIFPVVTVVVLLWSSVKRALSYVVNSIVNAIAAHRV